jgi:HSP20 family protein
LSKLLSNTTTITMALSLFNTDYHDLFGPFFERHELEAARRAVSGRSMRGFGSFGAVDLLQDSDSYTLTMDTPGLDVDDVKVQVHDGNLLTVSGERSSERTEEGSNYYERSYGKFSRSFRLLDNADTSGLSAEMNRGVLTITVPKREPDPPSVVDVPITSTSSLEAENRSRPNTRRLRRSNASHD